MLKADSEGWPVAIKNHDKDLMEALKTQKTGE